MGLLGGLVTLNPFPGVYCQGLLSKYFDAFTLVTFWCFLLCSYAYSSFIMLLIRLQIVARGGKTFDCNQSYYYVVYGIIAFFVYFPVPGLMFLSRRTPEEMSDFKFPNNLQVLEHNGIHIFTELDKTSFVNFVMVGTVVGAFGYLVGIYICIYRATRVHAIQKSSRHIKEHLRSLYNMIIQTTFIGAFMTISALLILKSFFNDPSVDSRISNTIAYSCLCGGSIPSQITMISRNTAYRNFVLRRKAAYRNSTSTQNNRRSTIVKV
ncbi:hypothetical protein GCK72_019186 [Caenorhabditis remanei]|uniref:Uncharacterized protein n=1 Tax=Caenorhabditis remanei TaxID=31234 RepID=A0A6A5GD29_CAERE|nr:hypothetical protein GCK72_019186 [Caenorhabditis remanei]KAF1752631.1 hypothetical protein GCK72_019186 [Caenorhabditis remanei]